MVNNSSEIRRNPVALYVAAFIIIIAGVMYAASIITPILMALFVSIICAQPILWMRKKGVHQSIAIIIVIVLIIGLFFGFGKLISSSLSSFSQEVPVYEENLKSMSGPLFRVLEKFGVDGEPDAITDVLNPSKIMGLTAGLLGQLGGIMGNTLTIFFLAVFLLFELDSIFIKTRAILKESSHDHSYLKYIGHTIRHYLSIKTVTSLLTGFFIWLSMTIIGIDYAILWALVAFLLNYIPNIGSILAAAPAVLFAFIQLGLGGMLWTAIAFVVVNTVIGNVLEPKMLGKGMGLSTFIVLLSLIFWGFILGTVGMFLSIPLTMSIKIMLEQYPRTKWMAIILGTEKEAQEELEK
jgi:AI-2 transport protein TqsA